MVVEKVEKKELEKIEIQRGITDSQGQLVVKRNDFPIRTKLSTLSLREYKIFSFAVSKVRNTIDLDFCTISTSVRELCMIMGIQVNGAARNSIKKSLETLASVSMWYKDPVTEAETLIRLLDTATIEKSGIIKLKLSEALKPYLLELRESYYPVPLITYSMAKSVKALALLDLIAPNAYLHRFVITVDELRNKLDCTNKTDSQYKYFKSKILNPSIEYINTYSPFNVKMLEKKVGRKVESLIFLIEKNTREQNLQLALDERSFIEDSVKIGE